MALFSLKLIAYPMKSQTGVQKIVVGGGVLRKVIDGRHLPRLAAARSSCVVGWRGGARAGDGRRGREHARVRRHL